MTTQTLTERIEALRKNLHISTDLLCSGTDGVDGEYIRAVSEYACMASGISTDHKESLIALVIELAHTTDPQRNVDALAKHLEASADILGRDVTLAVEARPEYVRALCEHACFIADFSGHHADSVQDILVGILTND